MQDSVQLELDLWQIFAAAQAQPRSVTMSDLYVYLENLDLIDGAKAIGQIVKVFRLKAEIILDEIFSTYFPLSEPILLAEEWEHLYQHTLILNDGHMYIDLKNNYPEVRQSSIIYGQEADKLAISESDKRKSQKEIFSISHSENISEWATQVKEAFGQNNLESISIIDLQVMLGLPLPELWLALILGDSGCSLIRAGGRAARKLVLQYEWNNC